MCTRSAVFLSVGDQGDGGRFGSSNIGLNLREVFQNRLLQRFADFLPMSDSSKFLADAAGIGASISFSCECSLSLNESGHESAVTLHRDAEMVSEEVLPSRRCGLSFGDAKCEDFAWSSSIIPQ